MGNATFNVTIHFGNGFSIERDITLKKAVKLASKQNVIIPQDVDYVEIKGMNDTLIVPLNMTFVISTCPEFKNEGSVSRYMLYKRDNGRCAYCEKEITQREATIDHILPRAQGGKTVWENVALACKKCNSKKDNKTPEQAGMKLKVTPYNPKKKKTKSS